MTVDNILQTIGHTPAVKFQRLGQGLGGQLYGKCEFLNPGGSVKDRAAYQMVIDAEQSGRIKPGDTLIEPTSGNTGIGLAMVGAVRGYNVIITMTEKMSHEKESVLHALGATIYRTPTDVAWDDPRSYIQLAHRLADELPNAHVLNQYDNPSNSASHYLTTAKEILADFDDSLAMVVLGVGTGGTVSGLGKRFKELRPDIQLIGADPNGSILSGSEHSAPFQIEGIGYDFFPEVLDERYLTEYIKVSDKDAFLTARRLIKEEGLLVGGSSGAAVWAALQVIPRLSPDQKCLVILPDSIRNYLSKFVSDDWMHAHGFMDEALLVPNLE